MRVAPLARSPGLILVVAAGLVVFSALLAVSLVE
jgi:hypothetical protein